MEVHHHAHTSRKKWTHYFWEFIMLFLAVFCGFLAENFREHKIEHMRAKQFAVSLVNDLREDTHALKQSIFYGHAKMQTIDSLVVELEKPLYERNDTSVYRFQAPAARVRPFNYNSGTYDQMKSSGSLRYFKQELTDLLNQYAVQASKTKVREDIHQEYASNLLVPFVMQHMDVRTLIDIQNGGRPKRKLRMRSDPETIALWINYATVTQSTQQRTVVEYELMLELANKLIVALKKEYHLE